MAVVLDSLATARTRTVFVKPPDDQRQWTAWPRAIVLFNLLNGVISAKPINDQQELLISVVLPGSLAYKFLDMSISLIQDVAQSWTPRAYLEVTNAIRNLEIGATQRHSIVLEDSIRTPVPSQMWVARVAAPELNMPRYVIQTVHQGAKPVISFKATNQQDPAGAAGTVNFYMSFLEYEIEQVERFPIHYPISTYAR